MTPSFWLALLFYLVAAAWTWFRIRPFMNKTLAAAEASTAAGENVSILFADILRELRRFQGAVPPERLERLVAALEAAADPKRALGGTPAASPPQPPTFVE